MRGLVILAILLASGCVTPPEEGASPSPSASSRASFIATSAAFEDGGDIPEKHTCDGADESPPLAISGAPADALTIALIMGDPDVPIPQASQRNLTHWLVWNVPLANGSAAFEAGGVPAGAVEGAGDADADGYGGPCPPALSPAHRYVFSFFAVDGALDLAAGATRAQLEAALDGHVVDSASLTGTYARKLPPFRIGS